MKKQEESYFLTEAEETKIPTREELERRAEKLRQAGKEVFNTTLFTTEEQRILLKGRNAAFEEMDRLRGDNWDSDRWDAIRDFVWNKCFRSAAFQDACIIYKQTDPDY